MIMETKNKAAIEREQSRTGLNSAEREQVSTKCNQVTAFMFYMWNAWCESECRLVWKDGNWKHFWDKWCGICKAYGTYGAAERFYAELSHGNRNLLVQRAVECFEGDEPKLKF